MGHRARPGWRAAADATSCCGPVKPKWSRRSTPVMRMRSFFPGCKLEPAYPGDQRACRPRRSATPGWSSLRPSTCARCSKRAPASNKPLILCSKGIEEESGAMLHRVASEACPDAADRRAFRPDLCARSRRRLADGGHARRRGPGAGRGAARPDRAADVPHLSERRRCRRRDRRRGQERARDRLRRGRRARASARMRALR